MGEFWKNRVSELEVECVKKQHEIDKLSETIKNLRTRCHENARENFDRGLFRILHIVGAEELKTTEKVSKISADEEKYLRENADFEEVLGKYMRVSAFLDKLSEENKQLKHDLKYKDGTKMFETLMENTEGEAKENLARHLYGNLKCVLWNEKMPDKDIIAKLEDRHQSDCITINQLQTTIDVLASRYAKLREQVGL